MVALRDLSPNSGAANAISMMFMFSNATSKPITELHFQVAVTKVCKERMANSMHQKRLVSNAVKMAKPSTDLDFA